MNYQGDFDASAVVYGKFTSRRPSTGASFTLGGTPALSVYKDNSTTQSTTGVTLTADFDSVTGLNHYAIDTSADGTFYSAGSFFEIIITTGTVDSISVTGTVVGSFTLRKTSALKPTTAGRTLDVSSTGEAGVDLANVGSPTTTLNLSGTTIKTATDVETDTADIQSRLPAALVSGRIDASVGAMAANTLTASALATDAVTEIQSGLATSANVSAVETDTQDIQSRLPAALVSGRIDASVGAMAANVLTAAAIDTGAITAAKFAAGAIDAAAIATDAIDSDAIAASAVTEIQSGLATAAALTTVDTVVDAIQVWTDRLGTAMVLDGSVYQFTANALELAPSGGGGGDATLANQVEILARIGTPSVSLTADIATVDTVVDRIEVDTQDIQSRLPAALVSGRIDASVGAMGALVLTASAIATGAFTATKFAAGAIDSTVLADDAITAAKIATGAIDADAIASAALTSAKFDAMADLAAVPAATASLFAGLNFVFMATRNKYTETATTGTLFRDDASTSMGTRTLSDDGTTFTRGEIG